MNGCRPAAACLRAGPPLGPGSLAAVPLDCLPAPPPTSRSAHPPSIAHGLPRKSVHPLPGSGISGVLYREGGWLRMALMPCHSRAKAVAAAAA